MQLKKLFAVWADIPGTTDGNEQIGEIRVYEDNSIITMALGFDVTAEQLTQGEWEDITNA